MGKSSVSGEHSNLQGYAIISSQEMIQVLAHKTIPLSSQRICYLLHKFVGNFRTVRYFIFLHVSK